MSWSIILNGPKAVVLKEIEDAKRILESAWDHLTGHTVEPKDSVSLSAHGFVSWDENGKVTGSETGHSVGVTPYKEPKAAPVYVEDLSQ